MNWHGRATATVVLLQVLSVACSGPQTGTGAVPGPAARGGVGQATPFRLPTKQRPLPSAPRRARRQPPAIAVAPPPLPDPRRQAGGGRVLAPGAWALAPGPAPAGGTAAVV